jgi:hypothetical protein
LYVDSGKLLKLGKFVQKENGKISIVKNTIEPQRQSLVKNANLRRKKT